MSLAFLHRKYGIKPSNEFVREWCDSFSRILDGRNALSQGADGFAQCVYAMAVLDIKPNKELQRKLDIEFLRIVLEVNPKTIGHMVFAFKKLWSNVDNRLIRTVSRDAV